MFACTFKWLGKDKKRIIYLNFSIDVRIVKHRYKSKHILKLENFRLSNMSTAELQTTITFEESDQSNST